MLTLDELTLATEEEIASALKKKGVINIRRIFIRKDKTGSRQTLTSWHLISPILQRRWRLAIVLRELSNTSQHSWGASNAKNMDSTGKPVENNTHVLNVGKRTLTTLWKIASKKFNVQNADKILQLMQDLLIFTKKKGNTWGETQEKCVLPGRKENSRDLHGRK